MYPSACPIAGLPFARNDPVMPRIAVYPRTLAVRVTEEDAERIKAAAASLSMSTADFLRTVLLTACEEVERVEADAA